MKGKRELGNQQPDKNQTLQKFEVPFFEKPRQTMRGSFLW